MMLGDVGPPLLEPSPVVTAAPSAVRDGIHGARLPRDGAGGGGPLSFFLPDYETITKQV
jgi:hypothetical protein